MAAKKIPLADRFWNKVNKNGPTVRAELGSCWLWIAATEAAGYGAITVNGQSVKSHRIAWEIHNGTIPDGLCVLHRCDNPPCVNPDHLFLGTMKDNAVDMTQKDRRYVPRGSKARSARLAEAQVRAIRASAESASNAEIARAYGLSREAVRDIVNGITWRHVS